MTIINNKIKTYKKIQHELLMIISLQDNYGGICTCKNTTKVSINNITYCIKCGGNK
jgi:hypothetical protein